MIKLISSEPDIVNNVLGLYDNGIENSIYLRRPEVYYAHPASLSSYVLNEISSYKNLLIVTYSEHVLNAVRIAVLRGLIKAEDVMIEYHTADGIVNPKLYNDGGIDSWPEGFFDQSLNDLMELLHP